MTRSRIARLGAVVALVAIAVACDSSEAECQGRPPLQFPPPLARLDAHHVIPAPSSVTPASGAPFTLDAATTIVVPAGSGEAARVGEMLADLLRPPTGFRFPVTATNGASRRGAIVLRLESREALGEEGYELVISADSVRITAARPAGLFYGVQTLRQLLPVGIEADQSAVRMASAWTVPPGRIEDRPRFSWRGSMLDVSRHFFTVHEVKQLIDILALYKMNRLHLHLSDDQGWRIQIDSWPKLTEIGGSTQAGGGPGGYYTKADYAEIVRYAQERYITVVPEIDMPGHTNAAIASYPELGCSRPMPGFQRGETLPPGPYTGIRVGWSAFCHDKEVVYRFVDDVVRELAAMTPGPYLHIGGDEVEVLTEAQYARFVERVQEIVRRHGKTVVGWEEIRKARLHPESLLQLWRADPGILRRRQGSRLILSPSTRLYVDQRYTNTTELGLSWAGFVELRDTYDWDPGTQYPSVPESDIVGVEAPLWSETLRNITAAQYMLMPRLPAVAELGWSDMSVRGWEGFRRRIAWHAPRWRLLGINYYRSPQVEWR